MTMTLIETKTVGTAVSSLAFTSIPADFTDLLVLISSRSTRSNSGDDSMVIKLNTVDGAGSRRLYGSGSAAFTDVTVPMTILISTDQNTSNTFANSSVYIPNYTVSLNKAVMVDNVSENNASYAVQQLGANLWTSTAVVNALSFTPLNGNLVVGSVFSLYGILKGSDGIVTTSP
jgi:hypothetical protein